MIKITKQDNIFDILEKIKNSEDKVIVLSFPFGHQVLYNKFLLKTIKNFVLNKKIVINTYDILSKKLIKSIGIKVNLLDKNKIDLLKFNYSFFEYLLFEIKKVKEKLFKTKSILDPRKKYLKYYRQKSNLTFFMFLLFFSFSIFIYLFFFVLNKTFVYIKPNIEVRTKSLNFTFKESNINLNSKTLHVEKITKVTKITKVFPTSDIIQNNNEKSHGKVILINKTLEKIKLLKQTRVQTKNGLLYEIPYSITIPKAIINKVGVLIPGKKEISVIAKIKDINGNFIGERGNIGKNTYLFFPGLNKKLQEKIFGKTLENFYGGTNKHTKVLTEKDIKYAKKTLKEELKKEAIKELNKQLEKDNENRVNKYKIINIKDIYDFHDFKVNNLSSYIGKEMDNFSLSGSIKVISYIFDSSKILSELRTEINEHLLKEKEKLIDIDENSLYIYPKVGIISRNKDPFVSKLTLGVKYYVEYNFSNVNDNYMKRLKQEISGLSKEEALKILINEKKISSVEINIRPFFMKNISKYLDNIDFIIK